MGRIAFFRVYSGKLKSGSIVLNVNTNKKERIARIMQMHANKQKPLGVIEAGDIGAAVGFKKIRTGDSLSDITAPIILENISFPEPVISIAIEPKAQDDVDKLAIALNKLAEEDPTFTVRIDDETGQTIINGMGELHLDILSDRLRREFNIECNNGKPQVAYKEAITKVVKHREVYKKQSGGRGKFADILVEISPAEDDVQGLQFINEVKGGNIPKEFIPSIEKGFKAAMQNGPLLGNALHNLKVRLLDGSFHSVDSDALSFEISAGVALRKACKKASPVLLEPIMKLDIFSPDEFVGELSSDLRKRRGSVEDVSLEIGSQAIHAKVPLAEMFGYVTSLRTITSGRATSSLEFSHFSETPKDVMDNVIYQTKGYKINS